MKIDWEELKRDRSMYSDWEGFILVCLAPFIILCGLWMLWSDARRKKKMKEKFGEESPVMVFGRRIGFDHYHGILYDILFNTRMLLEWREMQGEEGNCLLLYTEKEKRMCKTAYEELCALYEHECSGYELLCDMVEYLKVFFEVYDEREGADEYQCFKSDRWDRTEFPDKFVMDKSIW